MRKKIGMFLATVSFLAAGCSSANSSGNVIKFKGTIGDVEAREVERIPANLTKYKYEIVDEDKGIKVDGTLYKVVDANGRVYWFVQAFKMKDGKLVADEESIKAVKMPITADVKFLEKIDKEIEKLGINNKIGNPKNPKMYVIFDAFCPFCIESFKKHCSKFAKEYYISLIPFAVHGEASEKALACMLDRMKKENPKEVLGSYFLKFDGNWSKYAKLFENCTYDNKTINLVREIRNKLAQNKVSGTPTFFYKKGKKFYKETGIPTGIEK